MRRLFGRIALFLGLLGAGTAGAMPPVWTVHDADSEMVLFGSVHLLPPDLAWRPPALDAALKSADDLWFEVPSDAASQHAVATLAAARSRLPEGQTLSSLLSRRGKARLAKAAAELALPMARLDAQQPWMAEIVLSAAQAAKSGALPSGGVEQAIAADRALPAKVRSLETIEMQAELFAGRSRTDQVASLERTLRDLDRDPKGYDRLVAAWAKGDLAALRREVIEPLRREAPAEFKRMVTDRNEAWLQTLRERLAGSGRTVVVVGAGHLIGREGLPARLRALGYKVEGP